MALRRLAMLRSAEWSSGCSPLVVIRWTQCIAKPSPLDIVLSNTVVSPQFVLSESDRSADTCGFGFPSLPFGGGTMELMAVPRKKLGKHGPIIGTGTLSLALFLQGLKSPSISTSSGEELLPTMQVSRHKRGIRNGPKALKPAPVIIRCKVCGRVKLPHFFCCSGEGNSR